MIPPPRTNFLQSVSEAASVAGLYQQAQAKSENTMTKPNDQYHILIDNRPHRWPEPTITGGQLKQLAGVNSNAYDVWQDVAGPEDILVNDADSVDLTTPGTERFFTGKKTTTEG